MTSAQRIFTADSANDCMVCGRDETRHVSGTCPPHELTASEQAAIIADSVRAALVQLRDSGTTVDAALSLGIDRAIGNNAAQALYLAGVAP